MRSRTIIMGLACLALGLVAAIAFVRQPVQPPTPGSTVVETISPEVGEAAAPPPAPSSSSVPEPSAKPFSWRDIESDDYPKYIANLRAIGCPEQTIRDMILADVNKLYAARETPLKTKPQPTPDNPAGETPEQKLERLRQLRTLQQEKRWVVKELLGIDLPLDMLPSSGSRDYHAFEVALRFLPPDKRDAIQTLQETYWQQSDALKTRHNDKRTPEFVAEYRQLNDSLRVELGKVLTPQELDDYDMRTSPTAKQLGDKLATYFRPSEAEFRQIFRAKRDYEQIIEQLSAPIARPTGPAASPEAAQAMAAQRAADRQALEQARAAASTQMNEQLKSALGEDRFNEFERSQDRTYDLLARLGTRYNLPQETVLQAYDLQKSFKPGQGPVGDGAGQPVDRGQLQRQLNDQLTAILGEQAARGYRRVHGGTVPIN